MGLTGRSRAQLRTDTAARLVAANVAGGSVFANRLRAHADAGGLPAVDVYVTSETGERLTQRRPPEFSRNMEITINCRVSGTTDAGTDDTLDALIDEILTATIGDIDWGKDNKTERIERYTLSKDMDVSGNTRFGMGTIKIHIRAQMGTYEL